jgi:hypothetical protein
MMFGSRPGTGEYLSSQCEWAVLIPVGTRVGNYLDFEADQTSMVVLAGMRPTERAVSLHVSCGDRAVQAKVSWLHAKIRSPS